MEITDTLKYSIVIYIVGALLIYEMKPSIMFADDGTMKHFGLHETETVFPFWLVITILGISSYYLQICYEGKYVQ